MRYNVSIYSTKHCSIREHFRVQIIFVNTRTIMSEECSAVDDVEAPIVSVKPQYYVTESGLPVGPKPDVQYPLTVLYCGNCGLPTEYCEFYAEHEKCKLWFEKNLPSEFAKQARIGETEGEDLKETEDDKKRQKRGGKGLSKPKKKEGGPKKISLSVAPRGRKRLTCVVGLKSYDIDLKTAAKFFGTKFACGASVTGDDEIVIQGDVKDELFDLLPEKWSQIDEDSIDDLGEVKR